MTKCIEIHVMGRVQGVGFRYSTLYKAQKLGLKGSVKNNYDSTVTIIAEGEDEQIDELIRWSHQGPPRAIVESVIVNDIGIQNFSAFRIR